MEQRQQDIEKLATKVMGWHKYTQSEIGVEWPDLWLDANNAYMIECENWNPFKSWGCAGLLAEKLVADGHNFHFNLRPKSGCAVVANTGPAAIAEAALKVADG